jgi:membrane-associated phospholipid phosphatase
MFSIILLVALERVLTSAHYPSDTVAAAALGFCLAQFAWQILGRPRVPQNEEPK